MATHDQVIDNGPGLTVRTDINAAFAAIFSSSSGAVEPTVKVAGQLWFDISNPAVTALKVRNQANDNWVPIATSAGGASLPLSGGTMTGPLTLAGDPTTPLMAGTKQYIDNLLNGLDVKASCRAATTVNVGLTGTAAADGVSIAAGDSVLVRAQTAPAENGIYVVAAGAWSRRADLDSWAEVPGASVWIEEGTTLHDTAWVATADRAGTLGTTAIPWAQFGGTGAFQQASAVLSSIAALTTGDGLVRLSTSVASLLVIATMAQWLANAPATGVLTSDAVWSSAAPKALTDVAAIPVDLAAASNFAVTLNVVGATRQLAFPTGGKAGQTGWIEVAQDGTGGRLLTFAAGYKWPGGAAGQLSTAAAAVDMLFYVYRGAGDCRLSLTNAWA